MPWKNVVDAERFARQIEQFRWIEYGKHTLEQPQATITYHCSLQGIYHKNFELVSESFLD